MPKFDVTVTVSLERMYIGEIEEESAEAAEASVKRLFARGELNFDMDDESEIDVQIEVEEV